MRLFAFCSFFLSCKLISSSHMHISLSYGRGASMLLESKIIPKNGREVAGSSFFCKVMDSPSFSHLMVMILYFSLHILEVGGPMVKNSSGLEEE